MANNGSVGTKSRFSTLKVFRLGSSPAIPSFGQAAPPPPPPKDGTVYSSSIFSRSQSTLQSPTVSESTMNTGSSSSPRGLPFLTPHHGSSKVSLVSNGGGESSGDRGVHAMSRKASTFFTRFGKKKSSTAPPEPQGDDGISTPWNFQHQIHVNDSLAGLPPSWSSQLSQAGFSEEEIALLHARRAASASNPSVYLGRPDSPATTISSTHSAHRPLSPPYSVQQQQQSTSAPGPRPGPRSSSLRRKPAQQTTPPSPYPPPPVLPPDNRSTPSLSGSSTHSRSKMRSRQASQSSLSSVAGEPLPPPTRPPPLPPSADQVSIHSGRSRSGSVANIQPPRRPLVVTNGSPVSYANSPPPAYPGGPLYSDHQADVKDKQLYSSSTSSLVDPPTSAPSPNTPTTPPRSHTHRNNPSTSSPTSPMSLIDTPRRKSKRFSAARPPRLSLHQSAGESSGSTNGMGGGLGLSSGLGLGINEDTGWGDSVFEAMSATSSKFDAGDIANTQSSQTGGSNLLPAIVLSPTQDGGRATPSPSARPASPSIAPLSLIPSSSSPKGKTSATEANVLTLDDDKRRTYKPGESSPMWQEIIDIMDTQSPSATATYPRSPGVESTAPSSANTQMNFNLAGQGLHPSGNGHAADGDDDDDDHLRSRLSTATLLASAYQQSSRTHLSPDNRYSMLSVDSPITGRYSERSPTNRDSSQSTSSVISAATIKNVVNVTRVVKASLVQRDGTASTTPSSATTPTPTSTQDIAALDDDLEYFSDEEEELDVYHPRRGSTRPPSSPMSGSFGGSEETSTSRDTTTTSTTATSSTHSTPSPDDDALYGPRKVDVPVSGRPEAAEDWGEEDVYDVYHQTDEDDGQEIVYDRANGFAKPANGYLAPAPHGTGQTARGASEGLLQRPGQAQKLQDPPPSPITPSAVLAYYEERSPEPDRMDFVDEVLRTRDAFAGDQPEDVRSIYSSEDHSTQHAYPLPQGRPTIVVDHIQGEPSTSKLSPPHSASSFAQSPSRTYPGWVSELVRPLLPCIDESIGDPRNYYQELVEIAECESGSSIYAARVVDPEGITARSLSVGVKTRDRASAAAAKAAMNNNLAEGAEEVEETLLVAIKIVPLNPGGTPKLKDIEQELALLKSQSSPSLSSLSHPIYHQNIVIPDTVYIDLEEDSLWLRMELMERSVADVIQLIEEGLMLQERMIARVAADVLQGLRFLETQGIAHRDVRSDNLLVSRDGVVKIADFSFALKVTPGGPLCTDPAGVVYWQAPEVRTGPYDPMKVDVWSLGATVWEMAESQPPFSANDAVNGGDNRVTVTEQWPPLSQPNIYSPAFHEFLRICSQPAASRPTPGALLKSPFVTNACGRLVIVQLLSQCVAIEQKVQERENDAASA